MGTTNKGINSSADKMLTGIETIISNSIKTMPRFSSAIVDRVNEDGTVNIYFPPDTGVIFTNISNQTPFVLANGDSVEVTLKNGSYSNCWISAKHGTTNNITSVVGSSNDSTFDVETIVRGHTVEIAENTKNIKKIDARVTTLESQVRTLQSNVTNLQGRVNTLETNYIALEARVKALEEKE